MFLKSSTGGVWNSNGVAEPNSVVILTSNVNFDVEQILQIFVIALCAGNQSLNRKIMKMILHLSLHLQSYQEKYFLKIICLFHNYR